MEFQLVEPAIVPDIFASGTEAEDLGDGLVRFTYYAKQKSFCVSGATEYVIVSRIVMPISALIEARRRTRMALNLPCCGVEHQRLAH